MIRFTRLFACASLAFIPFACGNDQRTSSYDGSLTSDETTDTSASTTDPKTTDSTGEGGGPGSVERDPFSVPGEFEAEHFFRATGLESTIAEISDCTMVEPGRISVTEEQSAQNGCRIGSTEAGQWVEFDLDVEETASYELSLSLKRGQDVGFVSVQIDGVQRGRLEASSIFGFEESPIENLPLTEGAHVLRIAFDSPGTFFDYVKIESAGECMPICEGRSCGDDFCGGICGECSDGTSCSSTGQCLSDSGNPVADHGQLSVEGNLIVDEHGTPTQLRGISTQWLNWEQSYSTNAEGLKFMRDEWGLEVLRIANGVENDNGYATDSVRAERLEMVKGIIDNAIELGLYVLVDWHTHEAEYLDLAKQFYTQIAQEYAGEPNIIYEPFNEPIGEQGKLDQQYWANTLKPYHEEIVAHIRQYDDNNIIVLGTPKWSQGVDSAAANPVEGDNLAYTVHFYSCTHEQWLITRVRAAHEAGLAMFATEWGATHADGGTPDNPTPCIDFARTWHEALDDMGIGSAAWKLTSDGDASSILTGNPPPSGGWGDDDLTEHGQLVRELLGAPRGMPTP